MRTVTACTVDELAEGTVRCVTLERRPIALVRMGTQVFAFLDSCPHFGGRFSEGTVSIARGEVICPWQPWTDHLADGTSVTNPELRAQTFPVRIEDGQVLLEVP